MSILKFSFFLLLFGPISFGQTLHHQTLGSQGNAVLLANGVVVTQSIGQQSTTGNGVVGEMHIVQGFQQSSKAIRFITAGLPSSENVKTFPNPFSDVLNFEFSTPVDGSVKISVFDAAGRLVVIKETTAFGNKATVELANLQSGIYHLTIASGQNTFYATVIRK